MFRTTMWPSSGEITVSMWHLVLVSLYGWCIPDSHPYRVTSTKCHIDTVTSPDDGHSHLKHVEKRNKHTNKNCAPSWLYLQDPNSLFMDHPIIWYYTFWVTGTVTNRSLLLFFNYTLQPLRRIVRSWLDVPTFATRRLHACHHVRAPSGRRWNCGRKMSGNFA